MENSTEIINETLTLSRQMIECLCLLQETFDFFNEQFFVKQRTQISNWERDLDYLQNLFFRKIKDTNKINDFSERALRLYEQNLRVSALKNNKKEP